MLVMLGCKMAYHREGGLPLEHFVSSRLGSSFVAQRRVASGKSRKMCTICLVDALECLDRLVVTLRREIRAPQMTPEALRMIRVESHRLLDPFNSFLRAPQPRQDLALLDNDQVIVGIKPEGAFLMIERFFMIVIRREVDRR